MFVIVLGILSIILTLHGPVVRWVSDSAGVAACVALATLLPGVGGLVVSRRARAQLDRHPDSPGRGQAAFHRGTASLQLALGLMHAFVLLCTDWRPMIDRLPVVGNWIVVPGLLALIPFFVSILLIWTALYPADRAVRQIALEVYLVRGRPVHPVWSLASYLAYSFRHQVLFILVPMMLVLAATDLVIANYVVLQQYFGWRHAPDVLVGLSALGVAILAPEILRHVWVTRRLPDGPLRDRLLAICRRIGLRCREILVWRSGGMVVNAAVMGVVAPLRYVLITDAMLEQLDDTKIEAVFGHEAGHVKHRHVQCYLLFAAISGCLVTIFSIRTQGLARQDPLLFQMLLAGLGAVLMLKWGVVFGWISRRFERQADTFGVRTLSLIGLPCQSPCPLHDSERHSHGASPRDPLCRTGAHLFGDALHEVAVLNGIQPEARSWRHSSIRSRARFLLALAAEPASHARFQRRLTAIQALIVAAAAAAALWTAWEMQVGSAVQHWLSKILASA